MQRTRSPDDASALVAPTACRPAMTRAKDVANPLIDATTPAETDWKMGYRALLDPRATLDRLSLSLGAPPPLCFTSSDQDPLHRPGCCRSPGSNPKTGPHVGYVTVNRVNAQCEFLRDLSVGQAPRNQTNYIDFASGQAHGPGGCRLGARSRCLGGALVGAHPVSLRRSRLLPK